MQNIKVTVDGITAIGESDDGNFWAFNYEHGEPAFDLNKYVNEVGDVEYSYSWIGEGDVNHVSSALLNDAPLQEVVEWIMAVYPN